MTDQLLDAENWKIEASAVVKDVENHVRNIAVMNGTDKCIYFNVTTIEGKDYCIELSASGFRVAGTEDYYETPYSLLDQISPSFHKSFGNELLKKLNDLQNT